MQRNESFTILSRVRTHEYCAIPLNKSALSMSTIEHGVCATRICALILNLG